MWPNCRAPLLIALDSLRKMNWDDQELPRSLCSRFVPFSDTLFICWRGKKIVKDFGLIAENELGRSRASEIVMFQVFTTFMSFSVSGKYLNLARKKSWKCGYEFFRFQKMFVFGAQKIRENAGSQTYCIRLIGENHSFAFKSFRDHHVPCLYNLAVLHSYWFINIDEIWLCWLFIERIFSAKKIVK